MFEVLVLLVVVYVERRVHVPALVHTIESSAFVGMVVVVVVVVGQCFGAGVVVDF